MARPRKRTLTAYQAMLRVLAEALYASNTPAFLAGASKGLEEKLHPKVKKAIEKFQDRLMKQIERYGRRQRDYEQRYLGPQQLPPQPQQQQP